jgi:hypothetical protein
MTPRTLLARASAVSTAAGLLLAAVSVGFLAVPSPAGAAASAADGSDWGAQGTLASDSAVTVRWDNAGNTDADTVERNSQQKLPHTQNKSYASIPKTVRDAYASAFGADNGNGGLKVTVSQTQGLVNQAVTVTATGAIGGNRNDNGNYVAIFQCWGAEGESQPDPAHCQSGAGGADTSPGSDLRARSSRSPGNDTLLDGGNWAQYKSSAPGNTADGYVPFTAIDGTSTSGDPTRNTYYSAATTNEWDHATFDANGRVQRQFEMQTGAESSGLGCGHRADAPSTDTCWLVVVPRIVDSNQLNNLGVLAPQIWGQRVQVKLGFRDVFTACPGGRAALLLNGSEALRAAAASWTPGACESKNVTLGYTAMGDQVARNQYATGGSDAVLTTQPVGQVPAGGHTAYTPLALTAPVIAYTLDYVPTCDPGSTLAVETIATESGEVGENDAKACGYDSLAQLREDAARIGTPVTDLRLNARLVVKLLTQFYRDPSYGRNFPGLPAAVTGGNRLLADPEFQALNPGLAHLANSSSLQINRAFVEAARSDEAAALWSWALHDTDAASFLAGCPDPYGETINPFFSTRTYTGCEFIATKLEKAAASLRASVDTPDGYADQGLIYPPDGSPYPQPTYYQRPASDLDLTDANYQGTLTFTDAAPVYDNTLLTARQAAWYGVPDVAWCRTENDLSCLPRPGRYKAVNQRTAAGSRHVVAITDSGSAAKYQLATAQLCDDDGHCVGANTRSLQAAADRFATDKASGTLQPPADLGRFYAAGAYPLTMPVYAAVNVADLSAVERGGYADAFAYVTGVGQRPGFDAGELPPGYAPLTTKLRALAASGIAAIRAGVTAVDKPSASAGDADGGSDGPGDPDASTSGTPSATATTSGTSNGGAGVAAPPSGGTSPGASAAGAGTVLTATPGALAPVSAGTETWPKYTLPLGLAIALLSGLSGPLLRSRFRWKVIR